MLLSPWNGISADVPTHSVLAAVWYNCSRQTEKLQLLCNLEMPTTEASILSGIEVISMNLNEPLNPYLRIDCKRMKANLRVVPRQISISRHTAMSKCSLLFLLISESFLLKFKNT